MSVESAKKFVERLAKDEKFRAQVEAAPDPVARKKVVQAAGYEFDMADISAVLPQSAGGELSDQDLQGVAGGVAQTEFCQSLTTIRVTDTVLTNTAASAAI